MEAMHQQNNSREEPHSIFLSRNWGGDHYVLTIQPPVSMEILRDMREGLREGTGLGSWAIYLGETQARLTRHNDVGGDEGLTRAANHLHGMLAERGILSVVANTEEIPRTLNGHYEDAQ